MRTPFVVGNWKLHKTVAEALALVTELKNQLTSQRGVQVGVAPTFTALYPVHKRIEDSSIALCAQDCFWESKGAFTGEIAPAMLLDVGCSWAIVGHSERRTSFGDTVASVGKKAAAAIGAGLGAILCVGETAAQRDAGQTFAIVDEQLRGGLAAIEAGSSSKLVIAYEPVWAIGTGRTATPAQAQEVHRHLRGRLGEHFGAALADTIRIQYGGSVKGSNAEALMSQPDIDGALVGGASLDPVEFVAIVKAARAAG